MKDFKTKPVVMEYMVSSNGTESKFRKRIKATVNVDGSIYCGGASAKKTLKREIERVAGLKT